MKVRTSELKGRALDLLVARCTGITWDVAPNGHYTYKPSTDWTHGGFVIEREEIALEPMTHDKYGDGWLATRVEGSVICMEFGPTMLIAAMRCYVASHLGEEVDVPEEYQ